MHIVYRLFFRKRFENGILPFQYIGCKSNVAIEDDVMIGRRGKYFSSSRSKIFLEAMKEEFPELEILFTGNEYRDVLAEERNLHLKFDVAANPEYFNMSISGSNTYTDPNYATYKNISTGKIARLKRDHPKVIEGMWVGVTKGNILSSERKDRLKEQLNFLNEKRKGNPLS